MVLTTQYQVGVTSGVSPIKEPADLLLMCGCRASFNACLVLSTSRNCPKGSQGQEKSEQVDIADRNSELPGVGRILNPHAFKVT